MIRKPHIRIEDYNYDLPEDRIAQFPLEQRDASRLLIWKDGEISHDQFLHLGDHLPPDCTLVFNDTKVIRARLLFAKSSGARIEIFCLQPLAYKVDIKKAPNSVTWECLIGNAKRWKETFLEKSIEIGEKTILLKARKAAELENGCFSVEFSWNLPEISFEEIMEQSGQVPLPPYIHRLPDQDDTEHYQTVYAKNKGSVAAPTAGLHFTGQMMEELRKKGIQMDYVTLHVGLGTFRPVSTELLADHTMHDERIELSLQTIQSLLYRLDHPLIAIGTTAVR
ncbi:MAG: S-adenosylmethionine:tRNA ribosyltransferase-isomerase, partial [Bacteroidota bacterium]